jgi:hypothetical protein
MRIPPKVIAFLIATLWVASCGKEPALLRQVQKQGLVNNIQQRLLESVEAEKSAVLAITDEESIEFATQSKRSAAAIDELKIRLAALITEDGRREELEKLAAFTAKWDELREIDARLLDLAVANTNLKAARLLAREGSDTLDRLIKSIDAMTLASSDLTVVRSLAMAATAAARIQGLLFIHIPESADVEMTTIEAQIRQLRTTVDAALREGGPSASTTATADAARAWVEYQRIVEETIRLSRLNTNVRSFDVSIHEKRSATRACLDALAELRSAIESGPTATR